MPISATALRRVLRRARDGVGLNIDEAAIALTARGDDLTDLCASAARVRDAGLTSAGRRGPSGRLPVTYSRKVFIPVTHLCRDTCHYCTFVTVPGKLSAAGRGMYLEPDEIVGIASLPGQVPVHASQMYSSNITALLTEFWDKEAQALKLNLEDDILKSCVVTHGGRIVNEKLATAT